MPSGLVPTSFCERSEQLCVSRCWRHGLSRCTRGSGAIIHIREFMMNCACRGDWYWEISVVSEEAFFVTCDENNLVVWWIHFKAGMQRHGSHRLLYDQEEHSSSPGLLIEIWGAENARKIALSPCTLYIIICSWGGVLYRSRRVQSRWFVLGCNLCDPCNLAGELMM